MRGERVGEELRRELAEILRGRVRDPGLGLAMVTRVEVSPDGAFARIYVSFVGGAEAESRGFAALERATSFIRRELAHRLALRRVPELSFRLDHGLEHSMRVQQELAALGLLDEGEAPSTGESAGDRGEGRETDSSGETTSGDGMEMGDDGAPGRSE